METINYIRFDFIRWSVVGINFGEFDIMKVTPKVEVISDEYDKRSGIRYIQIRCSAMARFEYTNPEKYIVAIMDGYLTIHSPNPITEDLKNECAVTIFNKMQEVIDVISKENLNLRIKVI